MDPSLKELIHIWEAKLKEPYLLDIPTISLIELTIEYLKQIKEVDQ